MIFHEFLLGKPYCLRILYKVAVREVVKVVCETSAFISTRALLFYCQNREKNQKKTTNNVKTIFHAW